MRIGILGQLEVRSADGHLLPVGGARLRSFVIRLAASEGSPVSVDRLAEDLWPHDQPSDAANAIQALASRLRGTAGRDLIEYGPAGYRIAVEADQIDAWAFERIIIAARAEMDRGRTDAAAARFRQAVQLWRGPALADVADTPWAAGMIARLSELRLAALEDRIDADLALGRGPELVAEVEELATEHPLRERLRGQLMRSLYAAGRQADALAVFEDTRQSLAASLGIDPSPGLAAVHLAILRGELPAGPVPWLADGGEAEVAHPRGVRGVAPPGRTAGNGRPARSRSGNLPAQLTSFVGRDDELSRVAKLLEECRLITLTGPGGAGKTRLAIETGAGLDLPDGVWFVPLAPVRDALDVPQAVLAAIGTHEAVWPADAMEAARMAALGPLDRLCELLAARDLVLVLDNCEHLLDAAASLAAQVLAAAPGVRILATSREPLGVTGETLSPVPSLPLPSPEADPAELAGNPAVHLFADRAAAVRPGFAVNDENSVAVVTICRALDGIPLAIELAAARVRALTPAQVAARLADRFALLSVASRGTLPRHQTLRAIVDWSWDLLDDAERTILRRLSVFSGGATPESAEQVCLLGPGDVVTADGRDVIDIIASLLDKSLVTAGSEHHVRYRLLETVRAYAAERLAEAGETEAVAAAHVRYFIDLAERAEPQLRSRDQLAWLQLLSAEHDNFAAALRYSVEIGDAATVMRFVAALVWYWISHDYDAEAREWAVAAAQLAPAQVPAELSEAHAICQIVSLMTGMRDMDADYPAQRLRDVLAGLPALAQDSTHPILALIAPMLEALGGDHGAVGASLDRLAAHPDPWVRAARMLVSGHLALSTGDLETGRADFADAYGSFQDLGDRFGIMVSLSGLAEAAMAAGEPAEAVRSLEEARAHAVEGVAGHWAQTVRVPLGRARAAAGDIARGRAEIEGAVRFAERIGELDDAAQGYVHLSELAREAGDLTEARVMLEHAVQIVEPRQRRPDMAFVAATTFTKLGCVAEQEGDLDGAARWHHKALAVLNGSVVTLMQSNQRLAVVVEGIAALTAARGDHARAAEMLGLASRLQGYRNAASLEVARVEAASPLSDAEFEAAYASGRLLGQPDALALSF
jgi:predicted ATPase/DNA-binding SARP family transcriptional activator